MHAGRLFRYSVFIRLVNTFVFSKWLFLSQKWNCNLKGSISNHQQDSGWTGTHVWHRWSGRLPSSIWFKHSRSDDLLYSI